jgi:hypothetical protein
MTWTFITPGITSAYRNILSDIFQKRIALNSTRTFVHIYSLSTILKMHVPQHLKIIGNVCKLIANKFERKGSLVPDPF